MEEYVLTGKTTDKFYEVKSSMDSILPKVKTFINASGRIAQID
tara:strand:- start:5119 stop:5247 length:129 start_codon:yes stop_codon:yes gene_type:complete